MDDCRLFYKAQRRAGETARLQQGQFTQIASPRIGEWLTIRANSGGTVPVSEGRRIIACFEPGDRVQIFASNQLRMKFGLRRSGKIYVTFGFIEGSGSRDALITDTGRAIRMRDINQGTHIIPTFLMPRTPHQDPKPVYDEDAVRATLAQMPEETAPDRDHELVTA